MNQISVKPADKTYFPLEKGKKNEGRKKKEERSN